MQGQDQAFHQLTRSLQAFPNAVNGCSLVLGDSYFSIVGGDIFQDEACYITLFFDGQIEVEDPIFPWQVLPPRHLWKLKR